MHFEKGSQHTASQKNSKSPRTEADANYVGIFKTRRTWLETSLQMGRPKCFCLWPRCGFGGCSAPLLISCSYVLSANPASKPTPPNVRYLFLECGVRFPFIYPMSGLPQGCSTPTPRRGFEHRATYFPSASKRCVRFDYSSLTIRCTICAWHFELSLVQKA